MPTSDNVANPAPGPNLLEVRPPDSSASELPSAALDLATRVNKWYELAVASVQARLTLRITVCLQMFEFARKGEETLF